MKVKISELAHAEFSVNIIFKKCRLWQTKLSGKAKQILIDKFDALSIDDKIEVFRAANDLAFFAERICKQSGDVNVTVSQSSDQNL